MIDINISKVCKSFGFDLVLNNIDITVQKGEKVGIIGTIGTIIDGKLIPHKNTTPESYQIQKYMREMVDKKTKYLVMEVSSQALKVGRVNNIFFDYQF